MKPIIHIWTTVSGLHMITRGHFPNTWWPRDPGAQLSGNQAYMCSVSMDWFQQLIDHETELRKATDDLPF